MSKNLTRQNLHCQRHVLFWKIKVRPRSYQSHSLLWTCIQNVYYVNLKLKKNQSWYLGSNDKVMNHSYSNKLYVLQNFIYTFKKSEKFLIIVLNPVFRLVTAGWQFKMSCKHIDFSKSTKICYRTESKSKNVCGIIYDYLYTVFNFFKIYEKYIPK